MKHSERIAPLAAVLSAVASITCCLPLTIPAAIGLAGVGVFVDKIRPWLLGVSLVLLVVGLVQLYRNRACQRRSPISIVLFSLATVLVLALILFPQSMASILAGGADKEQARFVELGSKSVANLKDEFNKAADGARVILLLSPT